MCSCKCVDLISVNRVKMVRHLRFFSLLRWTEHAIALKRVMMNLSHGVFPACVSGLSIIFVIMSLKKAENEV